MYVLTLISSQKDRLLTPQLVDDVAGKVSTGIPAWLDLGVAADMPVKGPEMADDVRAALVNKDIDGVIQPLAGRRKKLFVADMDSTLIQQECIDELGKALGLGDKIAAITQKAMSGELDFEAALHQRVVLLKGLKRAQVQKILNDHIQLTPGARILVQTMRQNGTYTALVSGGFTFFAEPIGKMLGFDEVTANELEWQDDALTGKVVPPISDQSTKLAVLKRQAKVMNIQPDRIISVGDGANDVAMIKASGMGVAFRAQPIVAAEADAQINHADLTALLYIQGYRHNEIAW